VIGGRPPALLLLLMLLALALSPAISPARAQGLGLASPGDRRPLDIEADKGIEWRQNDNVYIARGNARATRGTATLYADTLIAHYRSTAPDRPRNADTGAISGPTEVYRVEADGNVRLVNETQSVYGSHAVYDIDSTTAVFTGKNLKLVTPRDTVTARDSLEWYDSKNLGVARGDALAIREDAKRLAGDVLVAQVIRPPNEAARINRIDAQGHVTVTTLTDIAQGASGVYNVDTGIATLMGGVTITRGENQLRGQYAVVDLNNNVSRILSALPGDGAAVTTAPGSTAAPQPPVHGLVVPRPSGKPASP
jgi:lipopolysaccharide export system protein LptA